MPERPGTLGVRRHHVALDGQGHCPASSAVPAQAASAAFPGQIIAIPEPVHSGGVEQRFEIIVENIADF